MGGTARFLLLRFSCVSGARTSLGQPSPPELQYRAALGRETSTIRWEFTSLPLLLRTFADGSIRLGSDAIGHVVLFFSSSFRPRRYTQGPCAACSPTEAHIKQGGEEHGMGKAGSK